MLGDSCGTHSDQCDIGSFPTLHTLERNLKNLKEILDYVLRTLSKFQDFFPSQSPFICKQFYLNVFF